MKRDKTGQYVMISTVGEEPCRAFVPDPLPPVPPLHISARLRDRIDSALLAIGGLNTIETLLPDHTLFLYMYVRKEAVLSSQIEGTQSSLSDLLKYEAAAAPGVPVDDVQEVSNYVAAMEHGMKRIREGFPLCLRLLREIHGVLLSRGRGSDKSPGEFRRTQNWIGGTRPGNARFVPPPPESVMDCLGALEKFLHDQPERMSPLIKAAIAHVQFETIHPFLDGNGRVGRLLITLILCNENVMREPMLYLSLYFKTHRDVYYDLLQRVRKEGDWEAWLEFFMEAVDETAKQAVATARRLVSVADEDRGRIQDIGRAAGSALRAHHALLQRPVISINKAIELTGVSHKTAHGALRKLEEMGIARELTGGQRNLLFAYDRYLSIMSEGTEPIR